MRTGLFGGAFNPVHNGHMAVARAAVKSAQLDRLIFIPTGNAPHKKETSVTRQDRYNMLALAVSNEENMFVSDYEINRTQLSYSADTVEYFKGLFPDDSLFFIMGDDSYNQLHTWHEPHRITENATLLVFPREGADITAPAIGISMDVVDVSSSEIREKIKMGKDCRNLLPNAVFDYIIKRNLYGLRDSV
ncbi:MAG: nicotinate (nicotinamide) nucleotide adenylyltransferase [Ruminococcaceae bacterium]|nr:nicotinate (nicotinamide) nucleotide adenylyltransferase [Oscillospiraceae bacterium]